MSMFDMLFIDSSTMLQTHLFRLLNLYASFEFFVDFFNWKCRPFFYTFNADLVSKVTMTFVY